VAIPLLTQLNVPLVFHNAAVVPLNSITIDVSGLFDGGLTEMEDTVPADDEEGSLSTALCRHRASYLQCSIIICLVS